MMERRTFLRSLIGGVAAAAALRTWPFRVYSFPTEIVTSPRVDCLDLSQWRVDLSRPSVLIRNGFVPQIWNVDGGDLGRGSGTSYRRVLPEDDLKKLFAEGWRDPRNEGTFGKMEHRCGGVIFSDR